MMIIQHQRYYLFFLSLFAAMFAVACSSPEPTVVTYGATLSDWEEVMQTTAPDGEVAQTVPTNDVSLEIAAGALEIAPPSTGTALSTISGDTDYQEIMWDALIPSGYTSAAIMEKYADQLAEISDGSAEATNLYNQMQEEFNNAPVNETLDQTYIKIPGFITPLEYSGEEITEFLLVPYFGACIHVPPPPVNQTVLVKTAEGHGIDPKDSFDPIWVIGIITAEGTVTELANAGYFVEDAMIEAYTMP